MRDIEKVLNDIIGLIPEDFDNREKIVKQLVNIIDDSHYRAPELVSICWSDAHIVLVNALLSLAESLPTWSWVDDIFELFSDGKWSQSDICKNKIGVAV